MDPCYAECHMCPRGCGARRREGKTGYCGMPEAVYVSRCAPHLWEEPPISGTRGSGTVFFTGCNLRCIFCQNAVISRELKGQPVSEEELWRMICSLLESGVHNINLVTPTHYTRPLARFLEKYKLRIPVPILWNSSGYEAVSALRSLEGLVDIYLPDFKYMSSELSTSYSGASDYAEVATAAILEMHRQVGRPAFDGEEMMKKGMIIRHLVLPGCRKDGMAVMKHLAGLLPGDAFKISLMRQYTPEFAMHTPHRNLHRRVTDFEYSSVVDAALALGLDGYIQGKDSATAAFTPDF